MSRSREAGKQCALSFLPHLIENEDRIHTEESLLKSRPNSGAVKELGIVFGFRCETFRDSDSHGALALLDFKRASCHFVECAVRAGVLS